MENKFRNDLDELKNTVLYMGALTGMALDTAVYALLERDVSRADEVILGDKTINAQEVKIDHLCLKLLALEQPVAGDLRFIIGAMRIAVDLERIGDQAVNIVQRAILLADRPPLCPNPSVRKLGHTAIDMFKSVMGAFSHGSKEIALNVCRMDDTADELNVNILKDLMDCMIADVISVERCLHAIIAARCLERVADHATNIAESVIFITEGVNIKHHGRRG